MIELHAETRVVKFPNVPRAVNYLVDARRQVRKANAVLGRVYLVDTKAAADYTVPSPNRLKPPVFVRGKNHGVDALGVL
jgi:hypothetical protein